MEEIFIISLANRTLLDKTLLDKLPDFVRTLVEEKLIELESLPDQVINI